PRDRGASGEGRGAVGPARRASATEGVAGRRDRGPRRARAKLPPQGERGRSRIDPVHPPHGARASRADPEARRAARRPLMRSGFARAPRRGKDATVLRAFATASLDLGLCRRPYQPLEGLHRTGAQSARPAETPRMATIDDEDLQIGDLVVIMAEPGPFTIVSVDGKFVEIQSPTG